jgi:aspartate 1-decarboxylase
VVHVNSKDGSGRIVTYVMEGKRGSGQVELNGGAANHFSVGDIVHVNCYGYIHDWQPHSPLIVVTGDHNLIKSIE